jgi:N6-adenosine-specific RNA methylase IME4
MKLDDIKVLDVEAVTAKDCALFLWTVSANLPDALDVIKAWGFKYKTIAFCWIKTTVTGRLHFGLGYWSRQNMELCLLATRGHPKRVSRGVKQVVIEAVGEHSAKPDEVRNRIVELMGNVPRLEMFARKKVEKWDVWGLEVVSDVEIRHK